MARRIRKPLGRPKKSLEDSRCKKVSIRLSLSEFEALRELGKCNVSKGLSIAVAFYVERMVASYEELRGFIKENKGKNNVSYATDGTLEETPEGYSIAVADVEKVWPAAGDNLRLAVENRYNFWRALE